MAPRDISVNQREQNHFLLQDACESPVNDIYIEDDFAPECFFCQEENGHPIIASCTCSNPVFVHKLCLEAWINKKIKTRSKCPCPSCGRQFPLKIEYKPIREVSQHRKCNRVGMFSMFSSIS